MNRRNFVSTILSASGIAGITYLVRRKGLSIEAENALKKSHKFSGDNIALALTQAQAAPPVIEKLILRNEEWKQRLTSAQYNVLRQEGTERPQSSILNDEKRKGVFHCAGCDLPVFTSEIKFDSGTGWPSFFASLPGAFEFRRDGTLFMERTEYHCAKCGGHHGHVFDDGPAPTGKRWCNNGVALKFKPLA